MGADDYSFDSEQSGHYGAAFARQPPPRSPHPAQIQHHSPTLDYDESTPIAFQQVPNPPATPPPNLSALRIRKRPSNKKLQYSNTADPQPALPDPSLFPDPYPYSRMAGSEGSSASARSSAYTSSNYTSPGSSNLRSSGTSITDFAHSEKNVPIHHHAADFPPDIPPSPISPVGVGLTADEPVQVPVPRTAADHSNTGESNSRWSSTYDGKPPSRSRSGSWSQFAPPEVASSTKSQFDWDTPVDERAEYEVTTDEEEESFGDDDYHDDHDQSEPPSAILVAEEGRGLIVQGAGLPVSRLAVNPGTTHLILTSSETPQQIPSFLLSVLPSITTTLLALDISCNFLNALPPPLAHCIVLEELNVASNPLRTLPPWLANLVCLRVLIADSTGLTTLPGSMASLNLLHTLSLRRNRLLSLPAWFCHLPSLESLLLEGNNFQGPWKALVDPLLPKAYPQSPMYPPNTPNTAVSMASESDYSDPASAHSQDFPAGSQEVDSVLRDYAATHAAPPLPPPPVPVSSTRSTSPYPVSRSATSRGGTPTPRVGNALSRTKTAPARHKQGPNALVQALGSLEPAVNPKARHSADSGDEDGDTDPEDHTVGGAMGNPMTHMQPGARESMYTAGSDGNLKSPRRMRSADELRRMGPMNNSNPAMHPNQPPRGPAPRPSREPMPPPGSQNDPRFHSLRANPDSRAQVSSAFFTPPPKRPSTATNEMPRPKSSAAHYPHPHSKTPSPQPPMPMMRPMPGGHDASQHDKDGKEKGKWGFLKKMSVTRLRSTSNVPTTAHMRPIPQPAYSTPNIHASTSPGPSTVSSSAAASASSLSISVEPSASSHHGPHHGPYGSNTLHRPPNTNPNLLTVNTPGLSPGLLSPTTTTTPRSAKRRSFLPLDHQPSLSIPIPANKTAVVALGEGEDEDARQSHFSDSPDAEDSMFMQQQRDSHARALRSVMAYLRDLSDLGGSAASSAPFANQPQGFLNNFASTPDLTASASASSGRSGLRRAGGVTPDGSFTSAAPSQRSLRSTTSTSSLRGPATSVATNDSRDSSGSTAGEEKKVKDDKNKRAMIVKEIVSTERTYVKGLQELVDIYIKPAAVPVTALGASSKETTVPAPERRVVFNGLDSLLSFHRESFLPALESAVTPLETSNDANGDTSAAVAKAVATVFLSHAAFMRMYSTYINNFDNAVQRIKFWGGAPLPPVTAPVIGPSASTATSAHITAIGRNMAALSSSGPLQEPTSSAQQPVLSSSQRKRIKTYLKRCRLNPRHSQLNLEGYLLLPVQRIPRYRMLLEELVRSTPIAPDAFYNPLEAALTEIASLAINMNEGKRDSESRRKLVQWQARIRGKFPSPLVQPHRRLIMDGNLNLTRVVRKTSNFFEVMNTEGEKALVSVECLSPELTPKSLVAILCNDLLVLCKDPSGGKDTNGYVDLWAVLRMQTLPQPASIVHGNALRLVDNKAILYFDAQSTSDALTWSRAINMHIPASK